MRTLKDGSGFDSEDGLRGRETFESFFESNDGLLGSDALGSACFESNDGLFGSVFDSFVGVFTTPPSAESLRVINSFVDFAMPDVRCKKFLVDSGFVFLVVSADCPSCREICGGEEVFEVFCGEEVFEVFGAGEICCVAPPMFAGTDPVFWRGAAGFRGEFEVFCGVLQSQI